MMFNLGYRASEPSGYSLLTTLWGKSPQDINLPRFRNADYDAAFEQFLRTPDGPERVGLARRMSEVVNAYVPIVTAGLSGGQRVRATVAARILPVAIRLHLEVHGHRSRQESRTVPPTQVERMKQKILVVVQEYPQVSETYIKNEVDALDRNYALELLTLIPATTRIDPGARISCSPKRTSRISWAISCGSDLTSSTSTLSR